MTLLSLRRTKDCTLCSLSKMFASSTFLCNMSLIQHFADKNKRFYHFSVNASKNVTAFLNLQKGISNSKSSFSWNMYIDPEYQMILYQGYRECF